MQFSDFAQKLCGALGGGKDVAEFTKTLFEEIVPENIRETTVNNILDKYSSSTYHAYFYGSIGISGITKKFPHTLKRHVLPCTSQVSRQESGIYCVLYFVKNCRSATSTTSRIYYPIYLSR